MHLPTFHGLFTSLLQRKPTGRVETYLAVGLGATVQEGASAVYQRSHFLIGLPRDLGFQGSGSNLAIEVSPPYVERLQKTV